MAAKFDPYHKWLGIPPRDQPPHHYRLLGLDLFESDYEVIDAAANQRMAYVQGLAAGDRAEESQLLLNELAAARLCLLDAKKRAAYDEKLRARLARPEAESAAKPAASTATNGNSGEPAASAVGTLAKPAASASTNGNGQPREKTAAAPSASRAVAAPPPAELPVGKAVVSAPAALSPAALPQAIPIVAKEAPDLPARPIVPTPASVPAKSARPEKGPVSAASDSVALAEGDAVEAPPQAILLEMDLPRLTKPAKSTKQAKSGRSSRSKRRSNRSLYVALLGFVALVACAAGVSIWQSRNHVEPKPSASNGTKPNRPGDETQTPAPVASKPARPAPTFKPPEDDGEFPIHPPVFNPPSPPTPPQRPADDGPARRVERALEEGRVEEAIRLFLDLPNDLPPADRSLANEMRPEMEAVMDEAGARAFIANQSTDRLRAFASGEFELNRRMRYESLRRMLHGRLKDLAAVELERRGPNTPPDRPTAPTSPSPPPKPKSPEEVLYAKGLVKSGSLWVLKDDDELRGHLSQLVDLQRNYDRLEDDVRNTFILKSQLREQLNRGGGANDPTLSSRADAAERDHKTVSQRLYEIKVQLRKTYLAGDAAFTEFDRRYAELEKDAEVQAARQKLGPTGKLGPSQLHKQNRGKIVRVRREYKLDVMNQIDVKIGGTSIQIQVGAGK